MARIKNLKYYVVTFVAISILLYIVLITKSMDNDMFFEIASGRDILNGNFYTASKLNNQPIVVQQWLYCVCLALLDYLGDIWLYLFVVIQNIILLLLTTIFVYKKTHDYLKSFLGSFIILLLCGGYLINIRPQIITMIFIMLELIILDKYAENRINNKNSYIILWLIPIFIASVNFHGAVFLYHIFILIPFYLYKTDKYHFDWKLFTFTFIFVLCNLCTPYGLDGAIYVINSFTSGVFNILIISELQPISLTFYNMILISCYILVAQTIWLIYKHKANKYIIFYMFSIFLLASTSVRHLSILYVAGIYILIACDFKANKYIKEYICIICLWFVGQSIISNRTELVVYLDKEALEANIEDKDEPIFNSLMLGNYLEYLGYNVYVDGRPEIFTEKACGENKLSKYLTCVNSIKNNTYITEAEQLELLKNYKYIILLPSDRPNAFLDKEFNKKYSDKDMIIWERK